MKKGRHRRYEEARELKRSREGDFDALLNEYKEAGEEELKPEHQAWADEFDDAEAEEG
ncbi:MAG: hypothetical protein ACI9C1_000180 [Candidatus Aldehydirespiratoraceae bacterium]